MLHRASMSTADNAAAVKDPLHQIQMGAGRVAKYAGIWAKKAGIVLRGDATRLVKRMGKALVKGGQAMMACSRAGSTSNKR